MKKTDKIRLSRSNMYEVSQRTGFDVYELETMLQQAYAANANEVVIVTIASTVRKVSNDGETVPPSADSG